MKRGLSLVIYFRCKTKNQKKMARQSPLVIFFWFIGKKNDKSRPSCHIPLILGKLQERYRMDTGHAPVVYNLWSIDTGYGPCPWRREHHHASATPSPNVNIVFFCFARPTRPKPYLALPSHLWLPAHPRGMAPIIMSSSSPVIMVIIATLDSRVVFAQAHLVRHHVFYELGHAVVAGTPDDRGTHPPEAHPAFAPCRPQAAGPPAPLPSLSRSLRTKHPHPLAPNKP